MIWLREKRIRNDLRVHRNLSHDTRNEHAAPCLLLWFSNHLNGLAQGDSRNEREYPENDVDDAQNLGGLRQATFFLGDFVDGDCLKSFVSFAKSENAEDETEAKQPDDAQNQCVLGIACYGSCFRRKHLLRVH